MTFQLNANYTPSGDQPKAISSLVKGLKSGKTKQILLGVTGSGKTFTMANVIAKVNRPALVIAHNKTLAAQLCAEFREFFPNNAVEYFVSYYDYYQPEAYIPSRDTYIEKEADINEEIERLRHSATRSLLTRRDVIIVASVSCIYGLGTPEDYIRGVIQLKTGDELPRRDLLLQFEKVQYERNDIELKRGRYRVKGETIDIFPSWDQNLVRIEFFGDEIERLSIIHPVSGEVLKHLDQVDIFPSTHYVVNNRLDSALPCIKQEMEEQVAYFKSQDKLVEAQRIESRTLYDLDMMAEMGYCKGIENYSRIISGREAGGAPGVLLDFFPDDFITIIDESHATIPQIRGMYGGDKSRKEALVEYGFRLPSAIDNRPLKFNEFESKIGQTVFVTATPGPYELDHCMKSPKKTLNLDLKKNPWAAYDVVEQIIRPTGLVDPEVVLKPPLHQIDDLIWEAQQRITQNERTLVTTLTKQMAEDLCGFMQDKGIKVQYLHSDIHTLDRIDILHDLRAGKYDVLIGVNLLREGLDLPEVSLVAILDADKEGFLRNERSLIQTIGRAARNINGKVILYAEKITGSLERAIRETNRRRDIQLAHNQNHNITPQTIKKAVKTVRNKDRELIQKIEIKSRKKVSAAELPKLLRSMEKEMKTAAANLEFEVAAVIRDQIETLKNKSLS